MQIAYDNSMKRNQVFHERWKLARCMIYYCTNNYCAWFNYQFKDVNKTLSLGILDGYTNMENFAKLK